jgi:hypothetical protein
MLLLKITRRDNEAFVEKTTEVYDGLCNKPDVVKSLAAIWAKYCFWDLSAESHVGIYALLAKDSHIYLNPHPKIPSVPLYIMQCGVKIL